ncbi:ferritin-like domain-containing protein [Paraburkholderia sp.]|uniref:ferritin-like domain-containing protein n=1 Tax=Paraburkholderia sp. TaxID=1926495 RepID=UPI003D6FD379
MSELDSTNVDLPVRALSEAEKRLVQHIDEHWDPTRARAELRDGFQIAVEIELATVPLYLFAYYSINRVPQGFPATDLSRFADQAGGIMMSVAVEEMLHLSLSSNILFSLGVQPQLYLRSPSPYPSNLPGHGKLGPDHKPMALPLAKFSSGQLWQFLEIEYPATADAPPELNHWDTIGQIYSYLRCIISSKHITDDDFQKGQAPAQIQPSNYSPNNIDSVYPKAGFNSGCPVPAPVDGSAAHVAAFASRGDSHAGRSALMTIASKKNALQAIQTIDAEGEGFGPDKFDDESGHELSHYYKFLKLQSQLAGYDLNDEKLRKQPPPPPPAARQFGQEELAQIIYDFPDNPVAAAYPPGRRDLAEIVSGLYQYMLIMTESIFRVEPSQQKLYFNQTLHRSMIWILDKAIQAMRKVSLNGTDGFPSTHQLAPTFENINLGPRDQAFATLVAMCNAMDAKYSSESWYSSDAQYFVDMVPSLPDVSGLWQTPSDQPTLGKPGCDVSKYQGIPTFPQTPPENGALVHGEVRHACMGLNQCKGQGRSRDNACAGQGYCSTALEFNFADPATPSVSDHTCRVQNACAGQGGCGLYGTGQEQETPGANACATQGCCATPINAERFSTDGHNRGKSVWLRAREVFTEQTWPALQKKNASLPAQPPEPPHPDLFKYGPTIEWIQEYSGRGMTACGSSGMSGAGSCS